MLLKKNLLISFFLTQLYGEMDTSSLVRVSFDEAMEPVGLYLKNNTKKGFWKDVKDLYTKYIVNDFQYSISPRIPKIIHQIWLGSPFPKKYEAWQKTWLDNHPDWQYKLWTDKDVEAFKLENKKVYDKAINYGEKSDIARYEILYRIGGLYIDTDFECLKPFDVLHHCCNFYAGLDEAPAAIFNGLIASIPGHPILKACIENLKRADGEGDTTQAIVKRSGPLYFTKIVTKNLAQYNDFVVLMPTTFFYPWPWFKRFQNSPEQIATWVRPESMAIHHWEVSWNGGIF